MGDEHPATATDDAVRALVAAGHADRAATLVVRSLGPEVFGFLRAALGRDVDADEVFAATSERVWRSLARFQWQSSLRTWVYVIARHQMVPHIQGARRLQGGRRPPSAL